MKTHINYSSFYLMLYPRTLKLFFFFFNDTATTEIYTLSLHDALPIYRFLRRAGHHAEAHVRRGIVCPIFSVRLLSGLKRSEEHTSELQSRSDLVCRLLLEKKKVSVLTS